ncbi:hypothetical protein D3C81_1879020 [compost metagenome]
MLRFQVRDLVTQVCIQGIPGQVHIRKQGIAAFGRQFLCMQHGTEAGHFHIGQVGVPEMTGITEADRFAVLFDIRDDQDFRMTRQLELMQHMNLQRAETTAEINLLRRGDLLIAKYQQVVIQMCLVHP